MIAKTAQWGNSIGVSIPRDLAKKAGISVDSTVEIDEKCKELLGPLH